MNDQFKVMLKKHKLVTVCSTDNDGFGNYYEPFVYKGSSRSEKSKVEISIPSYRGNLMFYEHFEQAADLSPSRLSFLYLGGNAMGEVEYDFEQYTNVTVMDVFQQFASVNSLFHILSKLPNCGELRVCLSDKNILPSKEESEVKSKFPPYISKSLKTIKIVQEGDIDPTISHGTMTRFEIFLIYAFQLLPNLESFCVDGLGGKGRIYNLIDEFVKNKPNLRKHNVTLRHDGKTVCQPAAVCNLREHHPSFISSNPFISQEFQSQTSNRKSSVIKTEVATIPIDPRLLRAKRKVDRGLLKNVYREDEKKDDTEIIEVPVPPKPTPPIVHVTDEDESENYPKKMKIESPVTETTVSSPTSSKTSISSRSSSSSIPGENTLKVIGSTYHDWETSSSEEETLSNGLKVDNKEMRKDVVGSQEVEVNADKITAIASQIPLSESYLRDVLNMANAESPSVVESPPTNIVSSESSSMKQTNPKYVTYKQGNLIFERLKR